MAGDRRMICGNSRTKDMLVSLHPDPTKRKAWIDALELREGDVKDHSRFCSCHFPNADSSKTPDLALGKLFALPKKILDSMGTKSSQAEYQPRAS